MDRKEQLTQQAAQVDGDIRAKQAAIAASDRSATPEELAEINALNARFDLITGEIDALNASDARAAKLAQPLPRVVEVAPNPGATNATPVPKPGSSTITGGTLVAHNFANHGFAKGFGEYLMAVRKAEVLHRVDDRLMVNAVTTYGGEGVGADGGYALPPQFASGILEVVQGGGSYLQALQPFVTNSNLVVVPTDETTPWGSTGITAAATTEGASITATKPAIKQVNVNLYAAKALVHVSDENLQDVGFLSSYVMNKMGTKLRFIAEDWILNGDGSGQPLGLANGPGVVQVAKESSQTRATSPILPVNLANMVSKCFAGGMTRGFWLCNQTVLPSVWTMATSSTGYPLYLPDFTKAPAGILLGRPVYTSEACAIAGTLNDILFVDPEGYIYATKADGINTATTIAFAFDQGLQSFRSTLRLGGAPVLQAKIQRYKSTTSYIGHTMTLGV